jgi:putative Mg2+ transporter-C (MgtC) family protein
VGRELVAARPASYDAATEARMPLSLGVFAQHMLAALAAGGIIGMERSFHGRAAGFRTHALVAMSSSMLMLVTLFQGHWFAVNETVRIDPTRMAQGIMTGIGFLGAGVIFKEGLTVRGLTTAASIWTTAAIGILMGVGMYAAGALATALTLGVLSVFRQIENHFPAQVYAQCSLRVARDGAISEEDVRKLLAGHKFTIIDLAYGLDDHDKTFEYRMSVRTLDEGNMTSLSAAVRGLPEVRAFTLSGAGD